MADMEAKFPQNPPPKTQKVFLAAEICLRILTVATTLAAAWVTLTNKQSIQFGDFTLDARYSYSSAFKFFAYANIIACVLSAVSLLGLLLLGRHGSNPNHYFFLFLHDLLMMSLIVSGCSAATAVGLVGKYGNSRTGWMAVCDRFERFCKRGTTSVALSYSALACLLLLTVMSANKSRKIQV